MLITNILFSLSYFLSAVIGGFAAVSPNNVSPVWPAAGIALAAIFLYGYRVLPGVFMGTLLAQIYSFQDFSNSEKILDSLLIGSIIALGSSAQALFGAWLLHKNHLTTEEPLLDDCAILRFTFFGALISPIVAPTVGATTLLINGVIAPSNYLLSWGTWWVGDSVGVLTFTPIVLIFFAQPRYFWRERISTVALPLLALIALVLLMFFYSKQRNQTSIREKFDYQVAALHESLQAHFQSSVLDNRILKAYFDNSTRVTQVEFQSFTLPLLQRHPYMVALEWIPRVKNSLRSQFEHNLEDRVQILDPAPDHHLQKASIRAEYYPILWMQPSQNNPSVTGYDVANNIGASRLLHEIQATGQTLVSMPLKLLQDQGNPRPYFSYVIYSPVFEKSFERELRGIVASVFRIKDMADHVLASSQDQLNYLSINEGDTLVYSTYPNPLPHGITNYHLSKTLPIVVANKVLSVTYLPSVAFISAQQTWTIWFILLGGFVFTGFSGIGLLMMTGRSLKTEELIKERTSELNSAKKTLEQQNKVLNEALIKAEQGARAKDSFLTSMSHELRTPLTAILGFAQLLESDEESDHTLSEEQKLWVEFILSSGSHLLKLITDILDFAHLSSDKLTISMELVEFSELVKECLQMTSSIMEQKKITLETHDVTTCYIKADGTRIRQVLLNLLSNAVKYNRFDGHISVSLLIKADNKVRLVIEDTGLGIPENRRNEVFQAFNRIGRESTHSEGTGIGLVISKNLVERMSGHIGFDSREGYGSRFWIEFDRIIISEN